MNAGKVSNRRLNRRIASMKIGTNGPQVVLSSLTAMVVPIHPKSLPFASKTIYFGKLLLVTFECVSVLLSNRADLRSNLSLS